MSIESPAIEVLQPGFDFAPAVVAAAENGYAFASDVLTPEICGAMVDEMNQLPMARSSTVEQVKNSGRPNQVRQSHDRFYDDVESDRVPVARKVARAFIEAAEPIHGTYPELAGWQLNEAGYQRYHPGIDGIGPHRDRASDKLLAVTMTVTGMAKVLIREALGDPDDYTNTRIVDQYDTTAGSIMLLRSTGLADGERIIHEVLPPIAGSRLVLNLRMRPVEEIEGRPQILEG